MTTQNQTHLLDLLHGCSITILSAATGKGNVEFTGPALEPSVSDPEPHRQAALLLASISGAVSWSLREYFGQFPPPESPGKALRLSIRTR